MDEPNGLFEQFLGHIAVWANVDDRAIRLRGTRACVNRRTVIECRCILRLEDPSRYTKEKRNRPRAKRDNRPMMTDVLGDDMKA